MLLTLLSKPPICWSTSVWLDHVNYLIFLYMLRLSENAHLPFDRLMALSNIEGLRYPHPSSLRRTRSGTRYKVQGVWSQIVKIGE